LDTGNQSILQRMKDQEKEIGDRFDKADELLISKFDYLDSNNSQSVMQMKDDLKNKFREIEENTEEYVQKQISFETELQQFRQEKEMLTSEINRINDSNKKTLVDMKDDFENSWKKLRKDSQSQ